MQQQQNHICQGRTGVRTVKTHYNVYFTGVKMTNYWVRSPSIRMTSVLIFHVASPVEQKQDNWIIFSPTTCGQVLQQDCVWVWQLQCVLFRALVDCVCTWQFGAEKNEWVHAWPLSNMKCFAFYHWVMCVCIDLSSLHVNLHIFSVLKLKAEFVISICSHSCCDDNILKVHKIKRQTMWFT